jgi:LysM domain
MTAVSLQTPCFELPRRQITVVPPAASRQGRSAGSPVPVATRPATAPLHLTRRGRLTAGTLLSVLVLAAVVPFSGVITSLRPELGPVTTRAETHEVTVLPGDTLWSIASATSPDGDPRDRIAEIRELNGLESSGVLAGQRLLVPAP